MRRPIVYLIGAGPGDPGLITVRGLECLRTSDVVVHDHDISPRLLSEARVDAETIDIGAASAPEALAEEAINYLLADKAGEDKAVARLKTGDPFVFARGGEELLFLHEQGIPFEVVPGVPLSIGTAAYAGVPATYPGGGDALTVIRGHLDEHSLPDVDWASLTRLEGTVTCAADTPQLARVLESMLAHGWPEQGQAVVVFDGTLAGQRTLAGSASELLTALRQQPRQAHAVLVAGRVAGFREHLRWWDTRPLSGRRVLVTRPQTQADELVSLLTGLGAEAIEAPMIRIVPPEDPAPLEAAATGAADFDWIVFSSANAVDAFMSVLINGERDVRALSGPRLCATGTGTANRFAQYGITVDLVPTEFRAEAVAAAIIGTGVVEGTRILLPRSDIGRDVIAAALRDAKATVTEVVAYRTVPAGQPREGDLDVYGMLLDGHIDVVTFTSASAVRSFADTYGAERAADVLSRTVVAALGPVTAKAATERGIAVALQPSVYSIPALVAAIVSHYS
jgi:uroporphyrinogen III methyltransferase/synthase